MIKFQSKYQFQIPLQIYRTVEKVEVCDGNGQKFWTNTTIFLTFTFGHYFVFSWLRFKYTKFKVIFT